MYEILGTRYHVRLLFGPLTHFTQGNDPDEDSDREPEPPTKVVDKPQARSSKRDAPDTAPSRGSAGETRGRGGRGGRGGPRGGSEGGKLGHSLRRVASFALKKRSPIQY